MEQLVLITGICTALLLVGGLLGALDRKNFSPAWLAIAALLVFANDAMLTRFYGVMPWMLPSSDWNWQGKLMALGLSLLIASIGAFGWRRSGVTLKQAAGSMRGAIVALSVYCLFFLVIALAFDGGAADGEAIAFQLTMPGIEEEIFYRGILLLALNEAFRGRVKWLGVGWGWGAFLSCLLFGLAHALSYSSDAGFALDPIYLALTAIPSLLAVWLRERTGSLLMPIIAHNAGNSLPLIL